MKAAFAAGSAGVDVRDVKDPEPGPGDVLVRMEACGICGSDLEKVFGSYSMSSTRLGHEPAGVIVGLGANPGGLQKGDRVFTHHHVPCGECHLCRNGSETMCPKYSESNLAPCGLAEQYVVPEWNASRGGILKLPDSVSFEQAALIEPLACCIRAWNRTPSVRTGSAAVFGLGATGALHVMLARHFGFEKILGVDINDFRMGFAGKLGADAVAARGAPEKIQKLTDGRGADIAMVATGSLAALHDALDSVRKGGTVVMFGVPPRGESLNLEIDALYRREITLATSYAASDSDTRGALDLIASGAIDVGQLVTHRYPLSESLRAFEHARDGADSMKIVISGDD